MPKVLLVEDDNNLREIFQMRLQAEGYTAVVAADGEEGLVTAMKEKPDLVIADVMMPKLSGFEMVESLRAAPETKDQTNPTPAPADPAANPAPAEPSVNPVSGDAPADNSVSTDQQTTAQEENVVQNQINDFAGAPAAAPADDTTGAPAAPDATSTDAPAVPPATEPAPTPEAPAPETETPASPPDQTGNAL
jgi:CheY-like chemotaxis protein